MKKVQNSTNENVLFFGATEMHQAECRVALSVRIITTKSYTGISSIFGLKMREKKAQSKWKTIMLPHFRNKIE